MSVPISTHGGRPPRHSPGELADTFVEEALFSGRAGGVLGAMEVLTGDLFIFLNRSMFIPARSKVFSAIASSAPFPVSPLPRWRAPESSYLTSPPDFCQDSNRPLPLPKPPHRAGPPTNSTQFRHRRPHSHRVRPCTSLCSPRSRGDSMQLTTKFTAPPNRLHIPHGPMSPSLLEQVLPRHGRPHRDDSRLPRRNH